MVAFGVPGAGVARPHYAPALGENINSSVYDAVFYIVLMFN